MTKFIYKIIFIFLLLFSFCNAEIIKEIEIKGNERISNETLLMFSDVRKNENIATNMGSKLATITAR